MAARLARILIDGLSGTEAARVQRCVAGDDRIVAVADESRYLMATAAEFQPDLVVLVAKSDIAEVCLQCRMLKHAFPRLLVLVNCTVGELIADAGADDFLTSPIQEAELSKRVDNLLRLCGGL